MSRSCKYKIRIEKMSVPCPGNFKPGLARRRAAQLRQTLARVGKKVFRLPFTFWSAAQPSLQSQYEFARADERHQLRQTLAPSAREFSDSPPLS